MVRFRLDGAVSPVPSSRNRTIGGAVVSRRVSLRDALLNHLTAAIVELALELRDALLNHLTVATVELVEERPKAASRNQRPPTASAAPCGS